MLRLKTILNKDALSGLLFIGFGSIALYVASGYRFGSASRMGPGYFPFFLAGGLILLGAVILLKGLISGIAADPVPKASRPTAIRAAARPFLVLLATLLFGLLQPRLGLVVVIPLSLAIIACAEGTLRFVEFLVQLVLMTAFMTFIFVYLLGLPLQIWPS